VKESVLTFGPNDGLIGILAQPADSTAIAPADCAAIILNAGIVHRVGPNRVHVAIARRLAAGGISTLRLDLPGVGDSAGLGTGRPADEEALLAVKTTCDHLSAKGIASRFILIGICSGAALGIRAAYDDPRVIAVAAVDPPVTLPTRKHRMLNRTRKALDIARWKKLLAGGYRVRQTLGRNSKAAGDQPILTSAVVSPDEILRTARTILGDLARRDIKLLVIFTGDRASNYSYRTQLFDALPGLGLERIATLLHYRRATHTFARERERRQLEDDLYKWTDALRSGRPLALARTPARSARSAAPRWHFDGFEVSMLRGVSPERERRERALLKAGRALPLPHRSAWATLNEPVHNDWFITASDATGPCGAAALQVASSRALPGHVVVRCERFGPGFSPGAQRAALRALMAFAQTQRRVLRVHVETFAIDGAERDTLEADMETLGFTRTESPRCYEHTVLVSLDRDEASIFSALHRTARRHIRAADKHPVVVKPVVDPADFPRLDEISRETYERTGGTYDPPDWSRVVTLCTREPAASRLVGLYRTDVTGPRRLLAFAWACGHGDHVHYFRAASTRDTDLRMPLMYPIVWDLIRWAKQNGARHFDFGGITTGTHDSRDPLGGISDFKRYFSDQPVRVGAEWSFEPRPIQAHAARMMSSASTFLARASSRA
jgi:dienelactone hydrolase